MSSYDFSEIFASPIVIHTGRLLLTTPSPIHASALAEFYRRNANFFKPFASTSTENLEEEKTWINRIPIWLQEQRDEKALRFLIAAEGQLIGSCNFTQIFRGAFQACFLGYQLDEARQGQGLMSEALEAALRYIFNDLNLHRVMANYIPSNVRSARLLKRLGFEIEGHAKDYLLINGKWEDHVLTALTNPHWKNEQRN